MKKIKLFLTALAVLLPMFVLAQLNEPSEPRLLDNNNSLFSSAPSLGMTMGTQFSAMSGGASLFSQSVSPHLRMQPHRNLSLIVGTTFTSTGMGGSATAFGFAPGAMPDRFFSTTIYAFGAYQVNPRLIITGGAWNEQNNLQHAFTPQMNSQAFDLNARGMVMGMEYMVSENLRLGAEINVSRGYNPFNPMQSGMRPYSPNPFHRRNPW